MPRRLLKVEAKRLVLTCFETFIESNEKQLTKMNISQVFFTFLLLPITFILERIA
jgi:hypothetical protein